MVEACARIDSAGGWTDTPPITYEHGGVVCNAAVTLDGKRPIGAKASRIAAPKIVLVLEGEAMQVSAQRLSYPWFTTSLLPTLSTQYPPRRGPCYVLTPAAYSGWKSRR